MLRLKSCHSSPVTVFSLVLSVCLVSLPVAGAQNPSQSGSATNGKAEIKDAQGQTIGHADLAGGPKGVISSCGSTRRQLVNTHCTSIKPGSARRPRSNPREPTSIR